MNPLATPRGRAALLILLAVAALGAFAWSAWLSPTVPYLAIHRPAEWIVCPAPVTAAAHPGVKLPVDFTRTFALAPAPASATLRVQGFREVEVTLNGTRVALQGQGTWRVERRADVAALLREGDNTLVVSVRNATARPALWLALEWPGGRVTTDATWRASWAGAAEVPAALAAAPAAGPTIDVPGPLDALARQAPGLVLLLALAFGLVLGIETLRERGTAWLCGARGWQALLGALALAWVALIVHNSPLLHPTYGFDASEHVAYIERVRTTWSLPLANEGWQMYHPPLYYMIAAALLTPFGTPADKGLGPFVLRLGGAACVLASALLVLALLRALFPGRERLHLFGVLAAALLPVQIYLAHYPTNELLAGTLALAAVTAAAQIIAAGRTATRDHVLGGLALGGALLTKVSALLVWPPVLAALGWAALRESDPAARRLRTRGLALLLAVAVAVCGWHYARVAWHFGGPMVGNWDKGAGFGRFWQDPGYRSASDLTRFGGVFAAAPQSATHSIWDGLYATTFADAQAGGMSEPRLRPPWRDGFMSALLLMALVPTAFAARGALRGLRRLVRAPAPQDLLLAGTAALGLVALFAFTLKTPAAAQVKSFYVLAAFAPLFVAFALGADAAAECGTWRVRVVTATIVFCALTAYASFWVDADGVRAYARIPGAGPLQVDPRDRATCAALAAGGDAAEGSQAPARALVALARAARAEGKAERALDLTHRATQRDHDDAEAWQLDAELRGAADPAAASRAWREVLRIDPFRLAAREALAVQLEAAGAHDAAQRQRGFAKEIADAGTRR